MTVANKPLSGTTGGTNEPFSPEESERWINYAQIHITTGVEIPYAFTIGAVTIAGMLYLKQPPEDTYTKGVVFGAVNGTYELSKDNTNVTLYDPTTIALKVDIKLEINNRRIIGRACVGTFTGWSCSDWYTLIAW